MRVINVKSGEQYTVYCGRDSYGRKGIGLGNPFIVGRDGDRNKCCDLFEQHLFNGKSDEAEKLRQLVLSLPSDAVLACWCKPARCHCDSIVKFHKMHNF